MKSLKQNLHCLPIIVFPIVLFSAAIFSGKALFWGTPVLQFIPWHSLSIDILKGGHLPFWNPYNGMGTPLAANYQTAIFYPPNWIALLAGWLGGDGLLAWMHTLLISLHLVWMGFGMVKLLGRLGYNKMCQVISGLAFSLSGFFVARAGFFSMIWTAAWLPWIFFAASSISFPGRLSINSGENKINLKLAFFMGMQLLAGHAQLTWYTWLLLFAWLVVGGWSNHQWKGILNTLTKLIFPGLLALGLAAIQLVLTAQFLLFSQRSSTVDFDTAMTYSLWPWRLLGFLLPDFFGNPGIGNYWGYASFWEDAVYIGVLPFILAILTLSGIWKKTVVTKPGYSERTLVRFLWVFILISIILGLGKNSPIFPFLFRHVPTFDMFNSPVRFLIWAIFCLSILAGIGFNSWNKPTGKRLYWLRLGTAGGLAITLGSFLAWRVLNEISPSFIRATAMCGLFTLISGILTLAQPDKESASKARLWQIAVILFIGCDLCIINRPSIPLIDKDFFTETSSIPENYFADTDRIYISPSDEYFLKFNRFFTFDSYQTDENWIALHSVLVPNMNILQKISSINNFDPLVTHRYRQVMDYVDSLPYRERLPWYNLMDVTWVEKRTRFSKPGVTFDELRGSERFRVFYCAEFASNEDAAWAKLIKKMKNESGEFSAKTLIIEDDQFQETGCSDPGQYKIDILQNDPTQLEIKLSSSKPGWLMIADTWYPGWYAAVNSQETELYKGNYLFRAIRFEAGENFIKVTYLPEIFWLGACLSFLSLLLLTGILLFRMKYIVQKG